MIGKIYGRSYIWVEEGLAKPCQAATARSSPAQAQVGEQLPTVEYLIESGKSCPRKVERDKSRTSDLPGATMLDKPVELKAPRSQVLRYVGYEW